MIVAPELVDRFRRDLAAIWPFLDHADARLGLAVSGGGDSLALLCLAQAALPNRIEVATVDHGLRPESAAEAALVAEYCAALCVPHAILRVTVGKGNLQDRARTARYAALGEWCEERGLVGLATGHQLDDQAETVLMRLNRGSGVSGLSAIRALGTVPGAGVRLVRPLLDFRRAELAEIVAQMGWRPAADPTNDDLAFDRVRIRKALADNAWPDVRGIARSARHLAAADEAIAWTGAREYRECVSVDDGVAFYRAFRTGVGALIRAEVVRSIFRGFGASIERGAAATVVTRLFAGEKINCAGIQAGSVDMDGERVWIFTAENPRRAD